MSDTSKDPNRHKPRHDWYLADAQQLVRKLQGRMWALGRHVALGGGVLNHGYSDGDLDLYVLPIYRPDVDHALNTLAVIAELADGIGCVDHDYNGSGQADPAASAFVQSLRFVDDAGRKVDVFVVRP
jgi:hypothetical protein